jgi:hypothetical protein
MHLKLHQHRGRLNKKHRQSLHPELASVRKSTKMFDFGIELDSADTVSHFRLWPTTGERTALIDGDMLPYIVGHGSDEHRATYDEDGKYLAERCTVMDPFLIRG